MTVSENRCVCCGDIIPEGLQVCPLCDAFRTNFNEANREYLVEKQHQKKHINWKEICSPEDKRDEK